MNSRARFFCYGALLACLLLSGWIRFKERAMPLERDEGEYAYMGQLMLQGVAPYQIAANMKLPGTYAAYAAIMAVFGESASGIRLGLILVTSACALLIFLIGRFLWTPLAGTIAACSYLFLAIRPAVLGVVAHATHFVALAALAGLLLLLHAMDRRSAGLLFMSGLLFGICFLMKQPGILFAVFAFVYWWWTERDGGVSKRNFALRGGALAAGVIIPYALTCLWLLHAGVFRSFWFWTWTYAREYGSMLTFSQAWNERLAVVAPRVFRPSALWEIAGLGCIAPLWSSYARRRGGFLAGLCVASCLAVCPGMYFRPHYFILLAPAGALCIGVAVESAQHELARFWRGRLASLPLAYFVVVFLLAIHGQWRNSFHLNPDALSTQMYGPGFVKTVKVASFIRARAAPGDEIGIFGSEPEICFYTRLHCGSRFLYVYPLLEKQRFAGDMRDQMKQEMQTRRPRFLVYADEWTSWNWVSATPESRPFLDWAWDFSHAGYELVDQVAVPTVDSQPGLRATQPSYYVFERKDE